MVEGTVTGIAAGLEGEIVTGLVAGTVMIVGVSGGVMIVVNVQISPCLERKNGISLARETGSTRMD